MKSRISRRTPVPCSAIPRLLSGSGSVGAPAINPDAWLGGFGGGRQGIAQEGVVPELRGEDPDQRNPLANTCRPSLAAAPNEARDARGVPEAAFVEGRGRKELFDPGRGTGGE